MPLPVIFNSFIYINFFAKQVPLEYCMPHYNITMTYRWELLLWKNKNCIFSKGNIENIVMTVIKHLEINRILVLVYNELNKSNPYE